MYCQETEKEKALLIFVTSGFNKVRSSAFLSPSTHNQAPTSIVLIADSQVNKRA